MCQRVGFDVSAWCCVLLALALVGCAGTPTGTPREYLDEQTAATITVVQEPWIFTRAQTSANTPRDYLHLYAIDVNRMGDHRQYFAALQSAPVAGAPAPVLELKSGGQIVKLEAAKAQPRELGIAQPIAESYTLTAAWWYFPVDKQTLTTLAAAGDLEASLTNIEKGPIAYVLWRDGRDELSELTAVLP
jgi:hypothetical protein